MRRDVDRSLRFAEILEEPRDRHDAKVILTLTERGPFFRENTDHGKRVTSYSDNFADGRFVRKQTLLNHLSDDDHVARKTDIFIV